MVFPGSEPVQLDLEKLFLLAVSKENLDFKRKIRKNLSYKILKFEKFRFLFFWRFQLEITTVLHE